MLLSLFIIIINNTLKNKNEIFYLKVFIVKKKAKNKLTYL